MKPFQRLTKHTEGRQATTNKVLPTMDFLLHRYESSLLDVDDNDFMKHALQLGCDKMQKYWNYNTKRGSAYIAALVLDPTQKWCYFEDHWPAERVVQAKTTLLNLWSTYNHTPVLATTSPPHEQDETWEFTEWVYRNRTRKQVDELEQYLTEPLELNTNFDVIAWWINQRMRLPNLARMALNIFSIPPMSSEPERVFSSLKHMITADRASLKPDVIEALECVKHWMKSGVFTDE